MSQRSASMSRAASCTLTWMALVLLGAFAGCGDDASKSDPNHGSEQATQSGSATDDKPADPAKGNGADGKAKAAPRDQSGAAIERPGTLARPPGEGTLPADLRPPR